MELQQRIAEIKQRAAPIIYGNVSVNDMGQLETRTNLLDSGVVEGYGVIWGVANSYGEKFIKGAFAKSIRERGPNNGSQYEIKFLYQHNQADALSLFDEIKEDEIGLYFRTKKLDDVDSANRVIKQLRSGTLNNFSIGYDFVWEQMEVDSTDNTIIIKEAKLFEISVVSIPSDMSTFAIRSKEQLEDLHDDTEDFIKALPRAKQLEARQIFARHKALTNTLPLEQRNTAQVIDEPPIAPAMDYTYLLNNLK